MQERVKTRTLALHAVEIGDFSTVAGARSQILTHAVDLEDNRQRSAPVTIGAHTFVGTGVIILKGASLADCCVVAAGSVYGLKSSTPFGLYGGIPAVRIKDLSPDLKYFTRTEGVVH